MENIKLTEKHYKKIRSYGLNPLVEFKVICYWSKAGVELESLGDKIITVFLRNLFFFGMTAVLWFNYYEVNLAYLAGAAKWVRLLVWFSVIGLVSTTSNELKYLTNEPSRACSRWALETWQKKPVISIFGFLNKVAIVIGLAVNSFYVTMIAALIGYLIVWALRSGAKDKVQKVMDKTIAEGIIDIQVI